jgi:YfiH family protein
MFFSKKLKKFDNIKHCFFSRKNGFSSGIYKSLNCGASSLDNKGNVLKNIKYVSKKIGCQKNSLITLNQIHSNKVVFLKSEKDIKNKLSGDAIVTKIKNIGIGILAADCVPILLYDPKKKIIGCIHSGWKGAFNGIIKNTIKKFKKLNSNINDLIAVVGPCIGKKSYNVKLDFYNKFIEKNYKNKNFFSRINKNNYSFDLRSFVNKEMSGLGMKNIENINIDTFSKNEFFYSYRRSCLNKDKDYGRCISVILMT